MNLKSLTPQGRKLVETINEIDADETYELIDAEEDGDTITLTFSKIAGTDDDMADQDEDEG